MAMNVVEKILAQAGGRARVAPGDVVTVGVGRVLLIDSTFILLDQMGGREVLKVADPGRVAVCFDHEVPAPSEASARAHAAGRAFVRRFGIRDFHDVGADHGIGHVLASERAYALPGSVLVGSDSHTCSSGAMNCAARAVPFLDLLQALTTGRTWFEVAPTVRYDLVGRLGSGASAKDAFLSIAAEYGSHAATNLEFGGPGLRHLSIAARRTLATMAAELGAEFAVFEADDLLLAFVRARSTAAFEEQNPDPGAGYAARRTVDLGGVVPLLALPDAVLGQVVAVSHAAGTRIDQAFIGSCANGSLEDLEAAAAVVKGRKVASGVRMIVTPGSQAIYRAALKAGYVETLAEAGAIVTPATCGACAGGHSGVLGPGEVCITASTRNYKGRMGHASARIYMASPATVAASALVGAIAHPGEFVTECPT